MTPCGTICMIWRKRTTDWLKKTINLEPAPSECIFFRGCPTWSGGKAPVGASGGSEPALPPLPSMCCVPASEAEETSDISAYSYLAGTPDAVESQKKPITRIGSHWGCHPRKGGAGTARGGPCRTPSYHCFRSRRKPSEFGFEGPAPEKEGDGPLNQFLWQHY